MQRIGEERVLDIGGDQFLMLLLVLKTERDSPGSLILERMLHPCDHGSVHMAPVGKNGIERRPRERGAKLLLRHIAERVVIAVEEPMELRVKGLVSGGK